MDRAVSTAVALQGRLAALTMASTHGVLISACRTMMRCKDPYAGVAYVEVGSD